MTAYTDKENECPYCGAKVDAAMGADGQDHIPKKGDIGICFTCTGLHEFQDDLTFKELKLEDLDPADQIQVRAAIDYIQSIRTMH